ncbi:SEC23-interacting protein-like isoform X2 [Venturia canescens]|uniref:SEC23-interacting protein-like isoform X2 n=1 Tax=Venturia canescens TaxID=32260 RepID=UPI001C9C5C07|nr:SEC23-interacting protein-like isoform X2 [Venturia canescens]
MSDPSRKVKNPLLTAAGQGFPFEGYSTNALLMPITPATPAILQDVAPEESSAVKEPLPGAPSQPSASKEVEFPVAQDQSTISHQSEPARRDPSDQAPKQSYFGSILSSFPNLSLSSITGDTAGSQTIYSQQAGSTNPDGAREAYGFSQNPYAPSTAPGAFVAKDPTRDTFGQHPQGFSDIGFAPPPIASEASQPRPAVPTLPPSGGPGSSYRLGNQRRLKYAPPPDLTSSAPKQLPISENFFVPSQQPTAASAAAEYFTPSPVVPSLPSSRSSPGSGSNPQSGAGSLHGSQSFPSGFPPSSSATVQQTPFYNPPRDPASSVPFRPAPNPYDPGIVNSSSSSQILISSPREIPSRFPETATPQNTPANASYAGFAASYAANNPESLIPKDHVEPRVYTSSSGPTKFPEGLTFDVPSSAYSRNNVLPTDGCIIEPNVSAATNDAQTCASAATENSSFTLKSAAKVTAKLEHLLAEREEDSVVPSSGAQGAFGEDNKQATKSEGSEDLAEIDLTSSDSLPQESSTQGPTSAPLVPSPLDFSPTLVSESSPRSGIHPNAPAEVPSQSSSVIDSFSLNPLQETLPPVANFFSTAGNKREAPGAFYNPQIPAQTQYAQSQFFTPKPQSIGSNAPSQFSSAPTQPNSTTSTAQFIPALYNPNNFSAPTQNSPFPTYSPHFPPDSGIPTQNSFTNVLSSSPPNFPSSGSFLGTAMPEPTGSATLNPVQMSVSPGIGRSNTDTVPPSLQSLAAGPTDRRMVYRPVYHHWFYRKEVETKVLWLPFSMQDSLSLEEVHNSSEITPETTVATDGGRYDVDILRRTRTPVYWTGNATEVRRSSWFYKGSTESRYIPYEESISARLEEEYKQACLTDNWNRRVELNNGEYIVFHSTTVQVHHMPATSPEPATSWGNSAGATSRPKVVKRGVDEFNIDEGEPEKVDHLLFLVHGIGSVCDLKFRTVEEVVDEFRSISLQLVQSHYRTASMHGVVNRIEVLPISWHTTLHSEDTGIDKKLRAITLESIPKLRHFTNDTLLDILFYTSPIYCQTIMQTVGNEMNRLYSLFRDRNPDFEGSVYLGGHSLGSLILFDLLCHQKPPAEEAKDETDPVPSSVDSRGDDDAEDSLKPMPVPILKRRLSKKVSYVMGAAGTGQPFINYPQLSFLPQAFFALGSPIGMFVTVRGIDTLGEDFVLPTCPAFFNVFHPFDPVAYRVESLINSDAQKYRPMLIPHHKGRKRMHLELKETMARVGADLKQKLLDSVRSTWNSVYQLAMFHRPENQSFEQEIEKVVEEQLQKSPSVHEQQNDDDGGADFRVGQLNGGRRIDYVLQEAPFEYINEYIFALTSHVCYWESEDTMLMILKEVYGGNGIQADAQLPPQTMTIERASPSPSIATMSGVSTPRQAPSEATSPIGFDPTAPIANKPVGPPPMSGFVRKS